jgi:hypothetical protein
MKKYMVYSFGTLWTLVLIVVLVVAMIHEIQFQAGPGEHKLNTKMWLLQKDIQDLGETVHSLEQEQLELLANPYYE